MQIEFIGRNYQIDDRVRAYTEEKLHKLDKFLQEPVEIRVTLETEKHRQIAEVHVHHRLGTLDATVEGGDMYDAVNGVIDKVEKQARRSTRKQIDKRRRAGRVNGAQQQWPMSVVERESVGAGRQPRIIRSELLQIKPMSIDEAALQLDSAENGFVVFRDAVTDRVSVLYKRKDENYGLIAPEF